MAEGRDGMTTDVIKRITLTAAIARASKKLRRPVTKKELASWRLALHKAPSGPPRLVAADLERHLEQIAPRERLLTVTDAVERLAKDWDVCVTRRTVCNWIEAGVPGEGGERVHLAVVYSSQYSPSRPLIRPVDLEDFVRRAGPNLGRRGRPLKGGRD